jgi:hypothetical protein
LHPIKKNALSLQYRRTTQDGTNRMSTGFGFDGGSVLLGSAMHLLVKDKIGFTLDFSASYKVKEKNYVSVNLKNLFLTDTILGKNFREASLHYSASISNRLRLAAQSSFSVIMLDTLFSRYSFGWYGCVEKSFLFDPTFIVYVESKIDSLLPKKYNPLVGIGTGWQMNIGLTRVGFLVGYRNTLLKNNHEIYAAAVFTPSRPRDRIAPRCKLTISDSTISISSKLNSQQLLLSLACEEAARESGVVEWIVKISSGTWLGAPLIRTYAGGGLPPSTILWNMLNGSEKVVQPGEYFVQLIAADGAGNVGKSELKKIFVTP